jgi:hypothetical protein
MSLYGLLGCTAGVAQVRSRADLADRRRYLN